MLGVLRLVPSIDDRAFLSTLVHAPRTTDCRGSGRRWYSSLLLPTAGRAGRVGRASLATLRSFDIC